MTFNRWFQFAELQDKGLRSLLLHTGSLISYANYYMDACKKFAKAKNAWTWPRRGEKRSNTTDNFRVGVLTEWFNIWDRNY